MMDSSLDQCNQDNDMSKYNEEDNLDPRIQVNYNYKVSFIYNFLILNLFNLVGT